MTLPPPGPRPVDPRTLRGPVPDETVDPTQAVERAMADLDGLADRPLSEHVAVFERVHATLQDALASGGAAGRA